MIFDKLGNETVQLSAEDAKQALLVCSSLLACEDEESLRRLRQERRSLILHRKVFNIPRQTWQRGDATPQVSEDFALMDRNSPAEDFAGKAKLFDFGMDELRLLQPLILWVGLEGRYLSKMAREICSADSTSTRPISVPQGEIRRTRHFFVLNSSGASQTASLRESPEDCECGVSRRKDARCFREHFPVTMLEPNVDTRQVRRHQSDSCFEIGPSRTLRA